MGLEKRYAAFLNLANTSLGRNPTIVEWTLHSMELYYIFVEQLSIHYHTDMSTITDIIV